jgi:hypothetical protein
MLAWFLLYLVVACRGEAVEAGDGVKVSGVRLALTCCSIGLVLWCSCGGFEVYVLVVGTTYTVVLSRYSYRSWPRWA